MSKLDISTLETRGYVNVPYPIGLRAKVHDAVAAWKDFCALPNDVKQKVSYSGDVNVSGVGYELKLERGATKDLKEDFHLRLSERPYLESEAAKVGPTASIFVSKALELTERVAPVVQTFAHEAEWAFDLTGFENDTVIRIPRIILRFLHYFPNSQPGGHMAAPHIDKGGFTLHLYESHPGLEFLTRDNEWLPMAFTADETAIIPAICLQYRSMNRLRATCHRVIANEETAKSGRYSAVCFVDFANTPHYDKNRFGRLQDRPAGFNYAIPFSEFSQLFSEQ